MSGTDSNALLDRAATGLGIFSEFETFFEITAALCQECRIPQQLQQTQQTQQTKQTKADGQPAQQLARLCGSINTTPVVTAGRRAGLH